MILCNEKLNGDFVEFRFVCGELIVFGASSMKLGTIFSIKSRPFIGNTTLDPNLSFIMANQAQIKPGSFIYDPFVGTGSTLLACAYFGSFVMGSDISKPLLHGKTKSTIKEKITRDHVQLKITDTCVHSLTSSTSRVLVTMIKLD
ncbi:hypothetical protein MXB_2837 [Myxobolus squamalis]|nr:hypothetical protein MXB_2837 [Myxobolus squamalis]